MNNTVEQVSGVVTAIGDKFNGSVKVNGVWYANKKGFKNEAKVGDTVTLELSPWEMNGKKGLNITAVSIKVQNKTQGDTVTFPVLKAEKAQPSSGTRDFDAENRGKVRHGLTVALVPMLANETITLEGLKNTVNALVEFVMTGK